MVSSYGEACYKLVKRDYSYCTITYVSINFYKIKCLNTGSLTEVSVCLLGLIHHFFQLCMDGSSFVEPLLSKD